MRRVGGMLVERIFSEDGSHWFAEIWDEVAQCPDTIPLPEQDVPALVAELTRPWQ